MDRLLDDQTTGQSLTLARLRDGLRRDLEGVLNSRKRFLSWPAELEELDRSLLSYGLGDFTNATIFSENFRTAFIEEVTTLVRRLEPRISSFEVSLIDSKDVTDRTLRFRIVGLVSLGGGREEISFDSHVDPVRCDVVVRE
jgi:type VI secretion system protein ImpF